MATLSKKRQALITADAPMVQRLYAAACDRWGYATIDADLRYLWTLRCMWGVLDVLPFAATASRTLTELLYVAREVCHLPPRKE